MLFGFCCATKECTKALCRSEQISRNMYAKPEGDREEKLAAMKAEIVAEKD